MRFRILGPVEVWDGGTWAGVHAAKQAVLLAVLVLNGNHVVSADQLVEALWGLQPPATAAQLLHGYVARLRRLLDDRAGAVLVTRQPGYLAWVAPGEVDLHHFERLVEAGRQAMAAGAAEEASEQLRAALALWRGPALGGVGAGPLVQNEVLRLEESRLAALEQRVDADLACGRHLALVGELEALTAKHPLRERFHGQLMLALYRSGRQADALAAYRRVRRLVVDELGVEPIPDLQELERAILNGDAALSAPHRASAELGLPAGGPSQLPRSIGDFVGRQDAVEAICRSLDPETGRERGAVVVWTITGKPGVGKTALAIHAAHQARAGFPDGQLYAQLQGATAHPQAPAEVLAMFARALGVRDDAIPDRLEERIGLYRSLLADRRLLVVLDDAAGEAQLRPLLPGSPTCAVLVTSRRHLGGLEAVRRLELDVLDPAQAASLLAAVAGPERAAAEPEAVRRIAELCGQLPLALRIAGARLAVKPHWRLATFGDRLADERRRLDELAVGDTEVRASFAVSYWGLTAGERRAFRLLGLLQLPDLPAWAATTLLGVDSSEAEPVVERLVDGHLLDAAEGAAGLVRYRLHDLLAVFARERADAEEPAAGRRAALQRAVSGYVAFARRADELLQPGASLLSETASAGVWRSDDRRVWELIEQDPRAWFSAERAALVTAVTQAHAAGLWDLTWELALCLSAFFEVRSHWDDWLTTHELALDAARRSDRRAAVALVQRRLGDLHLDRSRWAEAQACLRECLATFADLGDRRGELKTLRSMGDAYRERSLWQEALGCFHRCMPIARELGDRREEAEILRGLGIIHRQQGDLEQAGERLEACLRLSSQLDDPRWEAIVRRSLGLVYQDQGRIAEALGCVEPCVAVFRRLDDRLWEAYTLNSLGLLHRDQGALEEAGGCLERARAVFVELNDCSGEAYALQGLGLVHHDQGRLELAARYLDRSLALFDELDDRRGLAQTLSCLGRLRRDQGQLEQARSDLERCLEIFQALGVRSWERRTTKDLQDLAASVRR